MPDGNATNPNDWQTFIQWLAGFAVVIGGIVAGWFGTKKSKQPNVDDEHERVRILEAQIAEAKIRQDLEDALKATRESFIGQISDLTQRVAVLEERSRGSRR